MVTTCDHTLCTLFVSALEYVRLRPQSTWEGVLSFSTVLFTLYWLLVVMASFWLGRWTTLDGENKVTFVFEFYIFFLLVFRLVQCQKIYTFLLVMVLMAGLTLLFSLLGQAISNDKLMNMITLICIFRHVVKIVIYIIILLA